MYYRAIIAAGLVHNIKFYKFFLLSLAGAGFLQHHSYSFLFISSKKKNW